MNTSNAKADKIWSVPFIMIFTVNVLNALGFHILTPILPKYAVSLELGTVVAGVLGTMFAITSILSRLTLLKINLVGRYRYALMLALTLIAISMAGYSISKTAWMLYAFRLVQGIGWGICTAVLATLAALALPASRVGAGIGLFGLGSVFGQALAPNLGLSLVDWIGYRSTFIVACCLPVTAVILLMFLKGLGDDRDASSAKAGTPVPLREINWKPLFPTLFIMVSMIPSSAISSFLVLSAEERGVAGIGLFFTINAFALLFARPFFGRVADKIEPWKMLVPALLLFAGCMVMLYYAQALPVYLLVAALYALSYGSINPTTQIWSVKSVDKAQIGVAQVIFYTGLDLGSGIGSMMAGYIAKATGYSGIFLWMTVPIALELAVLAVYALRQKALKAQ